MGFEFASQFLSILLGVSVQHRKMKRRAPGSAGFDEFNQAFYGLAAGAHALERLDTPSAYLQDGLDIQGRPQEAAGPADSPSPVQEFECIDGEDKPGMFAALFNNFLAFRQAGAILHGLCGCQSQSTQRHGTVL